MIHGRRRERTIELPSDEASPEFDQAYWTIRTRGLAPRAQTRTMRELVAHYRASRKYREIAPSTRAKYDRYIAMILERNAELDIRQITTDQVRDIHMAYADTPRKADWIVQVLRILLNHAIQPLGWLGSNPAAAIELYGPRRHFEPWPRWLLETFRRKADEKGEWVARTAIELAYWTGQRPGDVCQMRWDDIDGDFIRVRQDKRRETDADDADWIYMHPELRAFLDRTPRNGAYILAGTLTAPLGYITVEHAIRRVRQAIGAPAHGFTMHGLRATAATELAELDSTDAGIAAVTGHRSSTSVAHYRRKGSRRALSRAAQMRRPGSE